MERCPHCEFISKVFLPILDRDDSTSREYWLMTEVFAYLHKDNEYADECDGFIKDKE